MTLALRLMKSLIGNFTVNLWRVESARYNRKWIVFLRMNRRRTCLRPILLASPGRGVNHFHCSFCFLVNHAIILGWLIVWSILTSRLGIPKFINNFYINTQKHERDVYATMIVSHPLSDSLLSIVRIWSLRNYILGISCGLCHLDFSAVCSMERKRTLVWFWTSLPWSSSIYLLHESTISTTFFELAWIPCHYEMEGKIWEQSSWNKSGRVD